MDLIELGIAVMVISGVIGFGAFGVAAGSMFRSATGKQGFSSTVGVHLGMMAVLAGSGFGVAGGFIALVLGLLEKYAVAV